MSCTSLPRPATKATFATALVTLILATACAHQRAVDRAKKAEEKGNLYAAAQSYQRACGMKKDDQRSCKKAQALARKAILRDIKRARPICQRGEFDACASAFDMAHSHYPEDRATKAFLKEAGNMELDRCRLITTSTPEEAIARLRCIERARAHWDNPDLQLAHQRDSLEVGKAFAAWADTAKLSAATRYALLSVASCSAPDEPTIRAFHQARESFLKKTVVPLALQAELNGQKDPWVGRRLCLYLSRELTGAVSCRPEHRGPRGIKLRVGAGHSRPEHGVRAEERRVVYQSGVQREPNPAYPQARDEFYMAERNFREIEQEAHDREAACEIANNEHAQAGYCSDCYAYRRRERACQFYESIRVTYNQRAERLNQAQYRLNNTPEIVERPVHSEHRYTVRHHRWVATRWFEIHEPGMAEPIRERAEIEFTDSEHPGFAPADLAGDPLEMPADDAFDKAAGVALIDQLTAHLRSLLRTRAAQQGERCQAFARGDLERLGCRATEAVWARAPVRKGDQPIPGAVGLEHTGHGGAPLTCISRGEPPPAFIGVKAQIPGYELAWRAGLERLRGAQVASVLPSGPAEQVGVRPGDLLLRYDGYLVEGPEALGALVAQVGPGRKVPVELWRAGRSVNLDIEPAAR